MIPERFRENKSAMAASAVIAVIFVSCMISEYIPAIDAYSMDIQQKFSGITPEHPFGTDGLGRDMLSRMLIGGKNTFRITFCAVLISMLGAVLGVLSGYAGGTADMLFSRMCDALSAVPTFLIAMVMELVFGWGKGYFMYALGIAMMPPVMRLSRNLTLDVMSCEYIEAARALGVKPHIIILNHVLRNIAPQLAVHIAGSFGDAMLNCTMLGYLGVGISEPTPEWGNVIRSGYPYILTNPMIIAVSSAVVAVTILCFAIVGNAMRDAMAAKGREG